MRIYLTSFLLTLLSNAVFGQNGTLHELSVGHSFIWNRTTIFDAYSGARARNETGQAWSNGTRLTYTFSVSKKIYASIGLGYFIQRFGIRRGFDFYEPNVVTSLFYTTKNYGYKCISYTGGIGYRVALHGKKGKLIAPSSELRFFWGVEGYQTFQQTFQHTYAEDFLTNPNPQKRKDWYHYGYSVLLNGGLVRPIARRWKIGIDLTAPIHNRWRKDAIFRENTDEYHGTDFSLGASANITYQLK